MPGVNARGGGNVQYDRVPDSCPRCHSAVEPIPVGASMTADSVELDIAFHCPRRNCSLMFTGEYRQDRNRSTNQIGGEYRLRFITPIDSKKPELPESVANLSPEFVEIYGQALDAESLKLDQISGVGLRKALEFLVKDYCISQHKEHADDIRKMFLGKCIDDYIDDQNVRSCAKLATWLGNDETHYERRWEGKDIDDLKTLLRLTVNWIENSLLTAKYKADMESK